MRAGPELIWHFGGRLTGAALGAAVLSGVLIWVYPAATCWLGAAAAFLGTLVGSVMVLSGIIQHRPSRLTGQSGYPHSHLVNAALPREPLASSLHRVHSSLATRAEPPGAAGSHEQFVFNLIDTAQVIVAVLDTRGRILLVNRFMEELAGYALSEIEGRDWFSVFLPERDRERMRRLFLRAVNDIQLLGYVTAILTKQGMERDIEWHSRTLRDSEGQTVGLLTIGVDVTERKKAEESLRQSEERYRAIVQDQTELISRFSPTGTLTFVNDAYCRYFGEERDQLLGFEFWHHVPPEDQVTLKAHIAALSAEDPLATIEHPVMTPEGLKWQQWTDRAILGPDGTVVEIQAVGRDITAGKEAEMALKRERQRLYSLLDGLPAFVYLHDRDYVIRFANRAFRETFGASEGRLCHEVLRSYEAPCADCRTTAVLDSLSSERSECTLEKTGRNYQVFSYPFTDVDSTPLALELWIDVTEQKEIERALRQSESALRALSAQLLKAQEEERKRIAVELHDSIGSSLTSIKMILQNVLSRMKNHGEDNEEDVGHLLEVIQSTIEESRRIMTDLRPSILDDLGLVKTIGWFCREFVKAHPTVFVEESIDLCEEEIPEDLKIVIFRVMQEAFHNIAKHSAAEYVTIDFRKVDGGIRLAIEDNGAGFDDAIESAPSRKRHGLGLTGMKERTELSGGRIAIRSAPGDGTEVRAFWSVREQP